MLRPWGIGNNNISNSLHLAQIFVLGRYLFREANSFPRAKLEENCELRGADNVQGQISEPNGGYCSYYPSNIFSQHVATSLSIWTFRLRTVYPSKTFRTYVVF